MKNPSHWIAPPTRPPTAMGDARHPRRDLGHRALSGAGRGDGAREDHRNTFRVHTGTTCLLLIRALSGVHVHYCSTPASMESQCARRTTDSAAHVGPARQRPPVGRSSTTVTRIPDSDVEKPGSSGSVSSTGPEVAARRHGRRCGCDRNRSPPRSKSVTLDTRHVGGAGILRIRAFPIRPWRPVNRSSNGPATDEDCDGLETNSGSVFSDR